MGIACIFCEIIAGRAAADIVHDDELTIAVIDPRQHNPGHVLVMPRAHINDLRYLDERTGNAVMSTLVRVTRAVDQAFPNEGMSVWHSIGPAAFQASHAPARASAPTHDRPPEDRCGRDAADPLWNPLPHRPEGHLLAVIFDERRRTSELAVFDAADIERGPIARALLDHRVPMGFHGLWKSSRERPESP